MQNQALERVYLKNDFLSVAIDPVGAELKSIADLNNPYEYLWQGEAPHWRRTAPVLFPIVGALKDKTYYYNGVAYTMGQHGLARDKVFSLVSAQPEGMWPAEELPAAVFELVADEETKAIYPFDFKLQIGYTLKDRVLSVTYRVENCSEAEPMFFSIGGHPGFNAELSEGTCELVFEGPEILNSEKLDLSQGLIERRLRPIVDQAESLRLSPSVFDHDALIFGGLKSRYVMLVNGKSKRSVSMSLVGVPKLGIWSDKGPFVCLEPWWGIADYVDTNQQLVDKDMIRKLGPGAAFQCGYDMAFD